MKTLEEKRALSKWFNDSANWFVLFVQSREEQRVMRCLRVYLDPNRYCPFVPTRDYAFNKGRRNVEIQKKTWMSGYVFVASNASKEEFIGIVKPIVKQHLGIYKLLTNGEDTNDVMLSEHDKTVMFALLDENFNIPAIDAVVIGDKVQIVDGLFNGKIGNIKRVNIHKRYAIVEIELFNTLLNYEVMLDVLKTT